MLTKHARKRMQSRGIGEESIFAAVDYGRTYYARGAVFKVIGKKEIARYADQADLSELHGVHVVMAQDGAVLTTYRNRRFRRADFRKPRFRPHRNLGFGSAVYSF